uniref:Uncharacterized protein n=1 Tax=Candidatus Kentrum sp. FW TaxID=2126338 RepID=A0A450T2G8_9GAMM|nr:MAG: hypothetical protein BECKFW1821A_GA0114235_103718 [Candidatus Kentron sp. FW]VFJ60725.1 MAG: hypothetical protein BECKFW1821B_GA0114236_10592 [Candidatus Kentron sp. FW]
MSRLLREMQSVKGSSSLSLNSVAVEAQYSRRDSLCASKDATKVDMPRRRSIF